MESPKKTSSQPNEITNFNPSLLSNIMLYNINKLIILRLYLNLFFFLQTSILNVSTEIFSLLFNNLK